MGHWGLLCGVGAIWGHQRVLGSSGGVGASSDCRYSGTTRGIGTSGALGAPRGTISIIQDLDVSLSIGDCIERGRERAREREQEREREAMSICELVKTW